MLLAIVIAIVVFLVVNRVWRGAAPPQQPPKPASVEVQLVGTPPATATPPR